MLHELALQLGAVSFALSFDNAGALEWLTEFLEPCFSRVRSHAATQWRVELSSSRQAYAQLHANRSDAAVSRPCFAFDQQLLSLPVYAAGRGVMIDDAERSCFLHIEPPTVSVIADSSTRRFRYCLMLLLVEIATTQLRRRQLDIHASAVEHAGRAILISGPKYAGKTTLSLHLLRSGTCQMIGNDRALIGGDHSRGFLARGIPSAIKLRPGIATEFPELSECYASVDRPYLFSQNELTPTGTSIVPAATCERALSPSQLAQVLNVQRIGSVPLGMLLFPQFEMNSTHSSCERLTRDEVRAGLLANLYGGSLGQRPPTLFEELDGSSSFIADELANQIAHSVPGYRVVIGQAPHDKSSLIAQILQLVST